MPSPEPVDIEVTPFRLDEEETLPLAEAECVLGDEERGRASAFRFERHRHRYIRGRAMVRRCLAARLDRDPASLVFETGTRGKPHLVDESLHFNLSHSEDRAALAIATVPSIGIDIECFARRVDIDRLSRRCFRPSECLRLEGFDERDRKRAFFWTWTAKEARMKATGEGFALEPQRIEIRFREEWPEACLAPVEPRAWVAPVPLPDDEVACTVAALRPFRVIVCER